MHFLSCCNGLLLSRNNAKPKLGKIMLIMICCFALVLLWPFAIDISKSMNIVKDSKLEVIHIEVAQRKLPVASGDKEKTIPLIVHQLTPPLDKVPDEWLTNQRDCMDLNKEFEFMIWTDEKMDEFISTHYEWFYNTYTSYEHNIQRIDSFKYFALYHYGGIYIDLDIGCRTRINKITTTIYDGILPVTEPIGISNDVMAFTPKHTFLEYVIHNLVYYDGYYFLPYLTVMWTTGPLFLSVALSDYLNSLEQESKRADVIHNTKNSLALMHHKDYVFRFFFHLPHGNGMPDSSWHSYDAKVIVFLYDWFIPIAFSMTFLISFYLLWVCCLQDDARRRARQVLFASAKVPRNALGSLRTVDEETVEYERDTYA